MIELENQLVRRFSLEFACDFPEVRKACVRSRAGLAEAGLAEAELGEWELMLAEAGNNAVSHAVGRQKNLPVRFDLSVSDSWVEAGIIDHTAGFDMPEVVELPAPDSEDGRGLYLVKSLSDQVSYYRGKGQNCLLLKKKRRVAAAGSAPRDRELLAAETQKLAESEATLVLMTEELASAYESLSTIFQFSAALAEQPEPEEFARKWLGEVCKIAAADWFVLRLLEEGAGLKLVACSADMQAREILSMENASATDVSLEARAASFRMDVWFDPAHPLGRGDPLAAVAGTGGGFAHPIVINDRLLGVLSVGRSHSAEVFEAGQLSLLQTFADFLGIQIRNSQFQRQQLQVRLTDRELEIAAEIQRSLLPKKLPEVAGYHLVGHYQSARQVGGDFYDALVTGEGGLLLAIADVMGKGVPAAMFAAIFRSQLRVGAERAATPGAMLTWLNRSLFADLDQVEMFITAQLVYFHPSQRVIHVAGAGHPPLVLAGSDGRTQAVENSGMPLGVVADTVYQEQTVALPAGAQLLLFTDGLTEARDPDGKLLWLGPLEKCLAQAARTGQSVEQTKAALISLVERHQAGVAPGDDQTFLLLAECRRDKRTS